jgi:hypothetical protein
MLPNGLADALGLALTALQILSSLAIIVAVFAVLGVLKAARAGNRVQLEIDLQVLDLGGGEQVGELMVVLQNVGPRVQEVSNLFIEVRPSRHVASAAGTVVPATNMVAHEDEPLVLVPGVRQPLTWTFEIPRDERLLRATAVISQGKWIDSDLVTGLNQKSFAMFGESVRYLSRVFDVSAAGFRRF